jgi:hypothetical protein
MLIDILGTSICPLRTNLTVQNVEQASQTIKYYVIKKKKNSTKCHRILVRSPENSTKYFVLLIARAQILFTFLSVPFVASNTLASLSSPSTNVWMDTGVTLPFLPVSQHFGLSDHSLEDFNRMKILVIEQNCLWSDFQRENRERFWIKELRVLHPDGINRKQ